MWSCERIKMFFSRFLVFQSGNLCSVVTIAVSFVVGCMSRHVTAINVCYTLVVVDLRAMMDVHNGK